MQASEVLLNNDADTGAADAAHAALPGATSSSVAVHTQAQPPLSCHSRFVQRLRRRYADLLPLLPEGAPVKASMAQVFEALRNQGCDIGAALRILRQLVMERLCSLDCDQGATLRQVTTAVTDLAVGLY